MIATKSSKVSLSPDFDALFNIALNSNSSIFSPNSSATLLIDAKEVVVALGSSKNKLNTFLRSSVVSLSGILLFTTWQKSLKEAPPKFLFLGLSNSVMTSYTPGFFSSKPIFCIAVLISLALIFPSFASNNSKASFMSSPSDLIMTF